MANKKAFDLDEMYRKIMPSSYDDEEDTAPSDERVIPISNPAPAAEYRPQPSGVPDNASLLQEKELAWMQNQRDTAVLYNLTEALVLSKLDMAMSRMSCCKCDRCKRDIIALALNNLEPRYVVNTKNTISSKLDESELSQEVTSAVLKAILQVRKNPRH